MDTIIDLLYPLVLTLLIEYPIVQVLWIFIKDKKDGSKLTFWKNRIIIIPALIVNILTNPAINIFYRFLINITNFSPDTIWIIITLLEFVIWALEAILYKYMLNTRWSNAFLLALSANYLSFISSFML